MIPIRVPSSTGGRLIVEFVWKRAQLCMQLRSSLESAATVEFSASMDCSSVEYTEMTSAGRIAAVRLTGDPVLFANCVMREPSVRSSEQVVLLSRHN